MGDHRNIPGGVVEGVGYGAGAAARGVGNAVTGSAKLVGKGVKALASGKTPMQRVYGAMDVAGSVGIAADMKHKNPVWDSIHG
jgi:hypothetical protein